MLLALPEERNVKTRERGRDLLNDCAILERGTLRVPFRTETVYFVSESRTVI